MPAGGIMLNRKRSGAMSHRRFWRGPSSWRSWIGGFVAGAVIVLVFSAVAIAPWLLTHRHSLPLERRFGDYAVSMAARLHAGSAANPAPADNRTLERGQYAFTGSCTQCHGPTGNGKNGALSATLFPPATDLTTGDAKEKSDAELFWITKNGLSFTGMPGFAGQYNDDAIWALVAYMRSLQGQGSAARAPITVPAPTGAELAKAGPNGDTAARGAQVYFAQNCQLCHGGAGAAPGELRLRLEGNDASTVCQIRNGPNGMPAYPNAQISDADMVDLIAFLKTLPTASGGGEGRGQERPADGARRGSRPDNGQGGGPDEAGRAFSSAPGSDMSGCFPQPGGATLGRPTP